MGDPLRRGAGVAIKENHCLNCHGAPETQPDGAPNQPYAQRRHGPSTPGYEDKCSAEPTWPPALVELQSQLWTLPFWVRSNFEKTLQAQRKKDDMAALPFRIDVGKATVELDLRPRSFLSSVGVNGTYYSLEVMAGRDADIFSHWEIKDNQLALGVRNLLVVKDVELSGPWGVGLRPQALLRDAAGELHLVSKTQGSLGLVDWVTDCLGGGSWEDIPLNSLPFIPAEFKDPTTNAIPEKFQLEDLLLRVFETLLHKKPAKTKLDFGNLLSPYFLKPLSYLKINIEDLKDFFIPNVLDLGPSKGEILLSVDDQHNLDLTLENPDIRLEAMDYPLSPSGERGGLKFKAGRIQAGDPVEVAHQGEIRPGLHLVRSTPTGNLEMEANLKIELELEDGTKLNTTALFMGVLLNTPRGFQPAPKFYFALGDIQFTDKTGKAVLKDSKLEINSPSYPIDWPYRPFVNYLGNNALINVELNLDKGRHVQAQGSINLTQNEFGAVEWKTLLQGLDLMAQVDYLVPAPAKGKHDKNYHTEFRVFAEPARLEAHPGEETFPLAIQVELESQDLKTNQSTKILEGLLGHLDIFVDEDKQFRGALAVKADALNFPGVMKKGLFFAEPSLQIQVEGMKFSKELWTATFPQLNLSVALNPEGAKRGMLQGVASLAQQTGKPFTVQWQPIDRQLKIDGMDWKLQLEKVKLDSNWHVPLKPSQSVGGDARLQVDFVLNAQGEMKKWNGKGKILLLGDDKGEVYLTNSRGVPIGAPLIRKTRWLITQIHRIDVAGGYPIVDGKLVTYLNTSSFSSIDDHLAGQLEAAGFGSEWYTSLAESANPRKTWESTETLWDLIYDNQPLTPAGFRNRNTRYLRDVCLSDPACEKKLTHPQNNLTEEGGNP